MITHQIFVENIKCSGCMNSIRRALLKLDGVVSVDILKEEDKVSVTGVAVEKEDVMINYYHWAIPRKETTAIYLKQNLL